MAELVSDEDSRPLGPPNACFYCGERIGSRHAETCVTVTRKVAVRATVEYTVDVPASWSAGDIEFHRNDSSWCVDNFVEEMQTLLKEREQLGRCLCGAVLFSYVKEANTDD